MTARKFRHDKRIYLGALKYLPHAVYKLLAPCAAKLRVALGELGEGVGKSTGGLKKGELTWSLHKKVNIIGTDLFGGGEDDIPFRLGGIC